MAELFYQNIIPFLIGLTTAYLIFYLTLSLLKSEIGALRLLFSGVIIALYGILKNHLLNPTVLLDLIISVIALLLIKRDYSFLELCKTGLTYSIVLLVSKGLEALMISYVDPSETLSSLIVCYSILLTSFIVRLIARLTDGGRRRLVYSVELSSEGRSIKTRAFWDSGNLLYDKGVPVILVSKSVAKKLELKGERTVAVNTVAGIKLLEGGDVSLKIFLDKKSHKLLPVRYCISDTIKSRGYDVLLHRDMEVI